MGSNHTCLAGISLDSVLKIDENYYSQVFLKEYKYNEKEEKVARYITKDIESFFLATLMKNRLKLDLTLFYDKYLCWLLFSLFIINQFCSTKMFYYKRCVFKTSGRQLFTLFIINQYCMKNVSSKQVGGCFLVYSSLISIACLKCFTTNFIKLPWMDAF